MSCSRCRGLMVAENLFSPSEGVSHTWVSVTRCLNCGNVEDPLIRLARRLPEQLHRRVRPGPQRRGHMDSSVMETGTRVAMPLGRTGLCS
jgi:hypothetical protein